jgi:hypothetical protein
MDDYAGPFGPDFEIAHLSRRALALLAREYQMAAHLQDRAGIPQVLARFGADAMRDVAIDEWMGASPVYTQRMRRALRFDGKDVATIFKGIQFDVGAPHGFLDFRFRVDGASAGEFWLPYCGALMDVEPMGEEFVVGMCHHIEDPTFDATAVATNPRARIRPIHRPPRVPSDRTPHCHWRVRIDPDATPAEEIPLTAELRDCRLSRLALPRPRSAEDGGLDDYAGPFDPDLELEDLSHAALHAVAQEFCVQGHLLVRAFMRAIATRWGDAAAVEIAGQQWVGIAGVAAERVAAAMRIRGGDLDAVARLLQLHPAFHPRAYVALRVERTADAVRCHVAPCDALAEGDPYSWFALPEAARHRALDAIVRTVHPQARSERASAPAGQQAWIVTIDATRPPAPEPPEVALTKLSKGATFRFASRRPRAAG